MFGTASGDGNNCLVDSLRQVALKVLHVEENVLTRRAWCRRRRQELVAMPADNAVYLRHINADGTLGEPNGMAYLAMRPHGL